MPQQGLHSTRLPVLHGPHQRRHAILRGEQDTLLLPSRTGSANRAVAHCIEAVDRLASFNQPNHGLRISIRSGIVKPLHTLVYFERQTDGNGIEHHDASVLFFTEQPCSPRPFGLQPLRLVSTPFKQSVL